MIPSIPILPPSKKHAHQPKSSLLSDGTDLALRSQHFPVTHMGLKRRGRQSTTFRDHGIGDIGILFGMGIGMGNWDWGLELGDINQFREEARCVKPPSHRRSLV